MYKKTILNILLVLILFTSGISQSTMSIAVEELEESSEVHHIIENVPYVAKEKNLSCNYSPVEMVFRYYGINVSMYEIFYNVGGGYAQGYGCPLKRRFSFPPKDKPIKFKCMGDLTIMGADDYKFLTNLYGCTYDIYDYEFVKNKEKCWKEYWEKVKYFVKQDMPVITCVDSLSWPIWREVSNTSTSPSIFLRCCCVIVIVGFNLTNNTVCVHDQYVESIDPSKNGMYKWVDIDSFKIAAGRAIWDLKDSRYEIQLVQKNSEPLPEELINELVHKRNIQKMKGSEEAYDTLFTRENFKEFGVSAVELLKEDIDSELGKRMPFYFLLNKFTPIKGYPFNLMAQYYGLESKQKLITVNYMMQDENISEKYYSDILLLEKESSYWSELKNQTIELKELLNISSVFKIQKDSEKIIEKMTETIGSIVQIQKMIILNNSV